MKKTWLITGCSAGGFGEYMARAALAAGHNVAVTARNTAKVGDIIKDYPETAFPVTLDVTDNNSIARAMKEIVDHFGTVDVLVNNAGYCYRSSVEESEEDGVMKMFQTNFFGLVAMTKAVLPIMRTKRSGMIINFSSESALHVSAASSFYGATKAAVELFSNGLKTEVEPLGIKIMVVEPGPFRTNFFGSSLQGTSSAGIEDYRESVWFRYPGNHENKRDQPGDPVKAGKIVVQVADGEEQPFRLLLGSKVVGAALNEYNYRMEELKKWQSISETADF